MSDTPEANTPPQEASTPPQEAADTAALDALRAEADDLRNKLARTLADLDNMRKRQAREVAQLRSRERETLLLGFLEVLDNFDRALAAAGAEGSPWLEGVEGIRNQMLATFARFGAKPFDAGTTFDANRHEAVAAFPVADKPDGTVLEVVQTGFVMEDGTLLRPAKVVVSRACSPSG
jgi:molecular chaperone GrpE